MFRKIVTESIYSPALAASLSDYVKKLKSETTKRQIGLIFIALAITVQTFAIVAPPESANASNPEVLVEGGIRSIEDYLHHYDQNTEGVRDLLTQLGIARLDIETTIPTTLQSQNDMSFWFMENSRHEENTTYPFYSASGEQRVAYYRSLPVRATPLAAYVGSSPLGWFAILKDSGNLVTRSPVAAGCAPWSPIATELQPVDLWSDTLQCHATLASSLSAHNISANASAASQEAEASDRIAYTLSIKNESDTSVSVPPAIALEDLLEYAQLIDRGGGHFSPSSKTLTWPETTLPPNGSLARSFIVQLLPTVPSTARGQHIEASYDCVMSASFGNTLAVPVACPFTKAIEAATSGLPSLPVALNLTLAAGLLSFTFFLYLRSKQLLTELRIIRYNQQGSL